MKNISFSNRNRIVFYKDAQNNSIKSTTVNVKYNGEEFEESLDSSKLLFKNIKNPMIYLKQYSLNMKKLVLRIDNSKSVNESKLVLYSNGNNTNRLQSGMSNNSIRERGILLSAARKKNLTYSSNSISIIKEKMIQPNR